MTAEGSTGAPLRQQIAETIHSVDCRSVSNDDGHAWDHCPYDNYTVHADAVVALLNLTPVARNVDDAGIEVLTSWPPGETLYRVGLPSTPPDTSSSEGAT